MGLKSPGRHTERQNLSRETTAGGQESAFHTRPRPLQKSLNDAERESASMNFTQVIQPLTRTWSMSLGPKLKVCGKLILYIRGAGSTWRSELAKEQKKTGLLYQQDIKLLNRGLEGRYDVSGNFSSTKCLTT